MAWGADSERSEEPVPEMLRRSRVARDLSDKLDEPRVTENEISTFPVIIEMNSNYPGGSRHARARLLGAYLRDHERLDYGLGPVRDLVALAWLVENEEPLKSLSFRESDNISLYTSAHTSTYLFGNLTRDTIEDLAGLGNDQVSPDDSISPIYRIWYDEPCEALTRQSARTTKCDAARIAFAASGEDIIWRVRKTSGFEG